ncbi:hypothetical protein [Mesorhizobium sp. WSM2561]|uniref:hypothetical protein n=1 Tax=Mesorhizobium sp. WSM2561 TaxID=1040985 RepID=UPI0004818258|nr:hypothetical protein [Mesorhizobium sp. WSM2561]
MLIVGSGLTSADMVAELDRRGHRGRILALSRRGLRSRGHPDVRGEPFGDFASSPSATALGLLGNILATLAAAGAANVNWQSVFDQLRLQGPVLWAALAPPERARLVRKLRVFWDVHRFRIAPQVASVLDRRQAASTFDNIAAACWPQMPRKASPSASGGAGKHGSRPRASTRSSTRQGRHMGRPFSSIRR